MWCFVLLALLPGQFPTIEAKDFRPAVQEAALAATVRVQNLNERSDGTGVIIGVEGPFLYVLTAGHVVRDGKELTVSTFTPDSYPKPNDTFNQVTVLQESQGVKDLALLRVRVGATKVTAIPFCPKPRDFTKKDFKALTVGCGNSQPPTCEIVEVVRDRILTRDATEGKLWEVRSPQTRGRSGGPMLNKQGQLIGLCSGNNRGKEGERGYFCHIQEIEAFLDGRAYRWLLADPKK